MEKEKIYRTLCFKYGVLTLCYLITEYAKEENYEEAQIILNAINSLNKDFDGDFPTVFNDKAVAWYYEKISKCLDKRPSYVTVDNLPHYAKELKSEVKKSMAILERQNTAFNEASKKTEKMSAKARIKKRKSI